MNDTMYKEKTLQIFSSSEKKYTREKSWSRETPSCKTGTAKVLEFRMYSRKELGGIYFPWLQGDGAASRALTRTIYSDPELKSSLDGVGFRKGIRHFSPNMVKILVEYLGSPEEFQAIQ